MLFSAITLGGRDLEQIAQSLAKRGAQNCCNATHIHQNKVFAQVRLFPADWAYMSHHQLPRTQLDVYPDGLVIERLMRLSTIRVPRRAILISLVLFSFVISLSSRLNA